MTDHVLLNIVKTQKYSLLTRVLCTCLHVTYATCATACIVHYGICSSTKMQFLHAIGHSFDLQTTMFLAVVAIDNNDSGVYQQQTECVPSSTEAADAMSTQLATFCDICLVALYDGVVLVPCGHSFCPPDNDNVWHCILANFLKVYNPVDIISACDYSKNKQIIITEYCYRV